MSRLVSLIVLVTFVIVFAVIFFWVMARFVLPLFMAALLVVIFRPLHLQIIQKCRGRDRVAAVITTVAILMIVLVPLIALLFRAGSEAADMLHGNNGPRLDMQDLTTLVEQVNYRFGLKLTPGEITDQVQRWLEPLAMRTPGFLGSFLIGLIVMIVALYYFLADGNDMLATATKLLPLERRHQAQLLGEFEKVARAVVSATLLSALAQGLLAGIGYAIAGLPSVFLLMMLTAVLAMVPFVGATAVWGACALWLYFVADRSTAAILLAVYGAGIISTIDNVIKPMILHGQSKLHPLLALLSVLGGVQALGPIGIFVGPMAVAFLQAGLTMLQGELGPFDDPSDRPVHIAG